MKKIAKIVLNKLVAFKVGFPALMFLASSLFSLATTQRFVPVEDAVLVGTVVLAPLCFLPFFV